MATRTALKLADVSEVFTKGGEGGIDLAKKVVEICETKRSVYAPLYDVNSTRTSREYPPD